MVSEKRRGPNEFTHEHHTEAVHEERRWAIFTWVAARWPWVSLSRVAGVLVVTGVHGRAPIKQAKASSIRRFRLRCHHFCGTYQKELY